MKEAFGDSYTEHVKITLKNSDNLRMSASVYPPESSQDPVKGTPATKAHSGTVGFPCFAFWSVQPKPLKVGSMLIPHFKALICGYLLVKRSKG